MQIHKLHTLQKDQKTEEVQASETSPDIDKEDEEVLLENKICSKKVEEEPENIVNARNKVEVVNEQLKTLIK